MGHRRDHEWLETFDGAGADRYDAHARRLRGMHERTAARIADLLPPGGQYLDVGSGPGTLLARVAALRPDAGVTGVDASPRMVEIAAARLAALPAERPANGQPDERPTNEQPDERPANERPDERRAAMPSGDTTSSGGEAVRARVLQGSAEALPLPDRSADVVSAVLTMHHWDDLAAGVAEVLRVLAPGGSVLVVEMRGPARHVARALRQAGALVGRENAWVYALPLLVRLTARRPAG